MARTIRNQTLDTVTARAKLRVRREPYWVKIAAGRQIGYRRLGVRRGSWIAKYRDKDSGARSYKALGAADDACDADGSDVLSYDQAQKKAREFFGRAARLVAGDDDRSTDGPLTVAAVLTDYFAWREAKGGKSVAADRKSIEALVIPVWGDVLVSKLTKRNLEGWLSAIAKAPARKRSAAGKQQYRKPAGTDDEKRGRQASANRVWATFKAALNYAAANHRDISDEAWRAVRGFREVSAARPGYLSDQESLLLVNASASPFKELVTAALLTGARYGELGRLVVRNFHAESGTVEIRKSKSGKSRSIVLSAEGRAFFARQCSGRAADDLILPRSDGCPWGKANQARPMAEACKAAKIKATNFHALRHTYASRLVMRGVPLVVIASQLGHTGITMVERHYGHLSQSFVVDAVRGAFGDLGIVTADNIVGIRS